NFDFDSSSEQPSEFPSLFVVNIVFKIKKFDFLNQQFTQRPKKYEESGELLALEILKSQT
ncbi:17030_t:CDS:1, partial [Dentiscutata erythropus]